jgi:hypothetical protein
MCRFENLILKLVWTAAIVAGFSSLSFASNPLVLTNLTLDDFNDVTSDFGALYVHSTVSPATSLGENFGFEWGLVGGLVTTPNIERVGNAASPGSNFRRLPSAAPFIGVSIPMGLKIELNILPQLSVDDVRLQNLSAGLQWNLSETILPLPIDLALRYHVSYASLSVDQVVLGSTQQLILSEAITGYDVVLSRSFLLVEPYLVLGYVQAASRLEYTGGGSVFVFTPSSSATTLIKSYEALVGCEVHLGSRNLGLEAGEVFNTTRALLKFSTSY